MNICRHCNEEVFSSHYCRVLSRRISTESDPSAFLISATLGAVTDSAIIGTLLGGSILGSILGDSFDGDLFD